MALSFTPAAVLAGAFAAAIAFAPAAAAEDADNVSKRESSRGSSQQAADKEPASRQGPARPGQRSAAQDVPKGWTNEAQWARPGASNIFGSLPKPPIYALD